MNPSAPRLCARYSPEAWAASHSGAVVMCRISRVTQSSSRRVPGATDVHVAPRLRSLDVARVERLDLEAGTADQRAHVAREVAATREALLPRVEPVLGPRDLLIGREPVLREMKRRAGLEDAPHLAQRGFRVGDRAEGHGGEHAV